jgi:hypothetical protein
MIEKTSPEVPFEEALLKTTGPERAAFREGACRYHQDLRARLEMMIEGHFNAAARGERAPQHLARIQTAPQGLPRWP